MRLAGCCCSRRGSGRRGCCCRWNCLGLRSRLCCGCCHRLACCCAGGCHCVCSRAGSWVLVCRLAGRQMSRCLLLRRLAHAAATSGHLLIRLGTSCLRCPRPSRRPRPCSVPLAAASRCRLCLPLAAVVGRCRRSQLTAVCCTDTIRIKYLKWAQQLGMPHAHRAARHLAASAGRRRSPALSSRAGRRCPSAPPSPLGLLKRLGGMSGRRVDAEGRRSRLRSGPAGQRTGAQTRKQRSGQQNALEDRCLSGGSVVLHAPMRESNRWEPPDGWKRTPSWY